MLYTFISAHLMGVMDDLLYAKVCETFVSLPTDTAEEEEGEKKKDDKKKDVTAYEQLPAYVLSRSSLYIHGASVLRDPLNRREIEPPEFL